MLHSSSLTISRFGLHGLSASQIRQNRSPRRLRSARRGLKYGRSGNPSRRIGLKQSFESFENIQSFSFAGLWVAVWVAAIATATATGVCVRTDTDSRIQLDAGGGSMSVPGQQSCCLIVLAGRPVQYLCSRRVGRPGGRCAGARAGRHTKACFSAAAAGLRRT